MMELNEIYTSHMVFPGYKTIRICGRGKGYVYIRFADVTKSLVSEKENWCIELPPMEYGGPYEMEIILEERKILLEDIFIGEVYLFSGQSNVEMVLKDTNTPEKDYCDNHNLRIFCVDRINKESYFTVKDGWLLCEKEKAPMISALAYLTGQKLQKSMDIAVGVIVCCQGASVIESWLPEGELQKIGINIPVDKKYIDHIYPAFSKWNGDGVLYANSLCKVIPYPISTVIWYQGESDTSVDEGRVYERELGLLIDIFRNGFYDEELPVVVVQLADYLPRMDEGWKLVQKAQLDIQKNKQKVYTVISADVCENDNIHPPSKVKLAQRIADSVLEKYEKNYKI